MVQLNTDNKMIDLTDNYYDFHKIVNKPDRYIYDDLIKSVVLDKVMENKSLIKLNRDKDLDSLK